MRWTIYLFGIFFFAGAKCAEDDSFAGTFLSGLLDSLTTTADSKDCPGICVHSLATIICYEVLDEVQCPSPNMKCCVESNNSTQSGSGSGSGSGPQSTTLRPIKTTNPPVPMTKPTHKVDKPSQSESSKTKDNPCSELRNGVCVAEHLAEYCEAYFTTNGLCKTGSKCCVHPDTHSDKMPSDLYIPNGQKNQTMPSKPTKPNVSMSSHSQRPKQPIKMHSSRPPKPQEPFRESVEDNQISSRPCDGECVSGLFALLCDDVDSGAYCENDGSCCVPPQNNVQPTSPRPTQPPKCPGSCMLNILSGLCNGVPIPNTSTCKDGMFCCDNTRSVPTQRPRPTQRPTTTTRRPFYPTTTQAPDYREDCPGTCIMSFISFTCFRNAEMTNLFKCKKEGTECCAPKSKILEYQGLVNRNDSFPVFVNSQPQQHIPQYLPNYPNTYQQIPPNAYAPVPNPYQPIPPPQPIPQQQPIPNNYPVPQQTNYIAQPQPQPVPQQVPQQLPQQSIVTNNYAPVPQQSYAPIPPNTLYQQNVVPSNPHMNLAPAYSTPAPTQPTTTTVATTPKAPVYSKYVCGVKGTSRNARKSFLTSITPTKEIKEDNVSRTKRQIPNKSKEVLILGSELVPIQIHNDKLGEFAKHHNDAIDNLAESKAMSYENVPRIVYNQNYSSYNRQARVVGGEDGENGEWCWQVALINSLNQYLCSAALIGTQWVLTAAHCVTNIVRSGDAIYVRVGDYDLTRKFGSPGAQTLRVATTYIHHNHNSQTLDNDIALLKLNGQAELLEGVCLVCLPARGVNHAAGKRCTVTGYGYITQEGPIPLRVREAELPIVSDAECIRKVNAVTDKLFILPASSFCAGGEPGNDACQGDGGGPLVCEDDGFYELAGLVSWGSGCGKADVPGVYVKVSSFIGWINQIISVNNQGRRFMLSRGVARNFNFCTSRNTYTSMGGVLSLAFI